MFKEGESMMHYTDYAVEKIKALVSIPSPTGMTEQAAAYIAGELREMGYQPIVTRKGTVLCDLGGEGRALLLSAHVDTLGAMVRAVKADGAIRYVKIGGFSDNAIENENCLVHSFSGKTYTGTIRPVKASRHVYGGSEPERNDETMEITLDEVVSSKEETQALGIAPGDFISFDPRVIVTESGFIKSRHLDDKASSGVLLALAKAVRGGEVTLGRRVYLMFTVFEEVGHGASGILPEGIEDMIAVDMGCVGDDLSCRETQVSICVKDSAGPYHHGLTQEIIHAAKDSGVDFATDVYPYYSSDTATALKAGLEARYALIGPGVYASHCYERTHVKGIENTLKLLMALV